MCSATGDPVAEPPAHTGREISYPAIVPSLAVTGCSQLSRREFRSKSLYNHIREVSVSEASRAVVKEFCDALVRDRRGETFLTGIHARPPLPARRRIGRWRSHSRRAYWGKRGGFCIVPLDRTVRQSSIGAMGFNRRKMEDQRRQSAEKEAARRRATDAQVGTAHPQEPIACRDRGADRWREQHRHALGLAFVPGGN
jgi:hypothetical protein